MTIESGQKPAIHGAKVGRLAGIGAAIGRIASGVYVVTLEHNGKPEGMLTSWVQQTSFEPPMLMICVQKKRVILPELPIGKKFVVNVLSKQNMDIYKSFAKPYTEGMDRFSGLAVLDESEAGPVLPETVAYLACAVRSIADSGDHSVVLAEIIDGRLLSGDAEPMVHLRKSGFQY